MLNKIDYYNHKTYQTPYYHRQYENDLPEKTEESSYADAAKRAALIALPFISLYQPLGKVISLGMGASRVVTHGLGMVSSDVREVATQVIQVALAILALMGTLYNFTLGLYLTTCADIITNLAHILEALYQGDYQRAGEELLQVISSGVYLAIMITGSLEVVLVSIVIQAVISLYQAREEWAKGRMPEAFAKTVMGMIRIYQAGQQIQLIQRRNVLLERYQELAERIHKGRAVQHLWEHPFIQEAYGQKGTILEDANGNPYDFGNNFHGHGKQIVKGMNVTFHDRDSYTSLDFKVNHVFRDRLEKIIGDLSNTSKEDLNDLLKVLGSHATHISVTKQPDDADIFLGFSENTKINLEGVGKIIIGASQEFPGLYDKVSIQMEKGKNLYDFHEALSFLNLDDVLRQSAQEDIERMKMGHLFRIFDPRAATPFERSDRFFDLSLEDFKNEICTLSPEMESVFKEYLPKMVAKEILPGRMRYAIDGLSNDLQSMGARGLTSALTGSWSKQEIFERTASILKMGMMASEMRRDNKVGKEGLSSGADNFTGGADSVYTQMVLDSSRSYEEFHYRSDVRFLISPKILETGTYQYHDDNWGTRLLNPEMWFFGDEYQKRDSIFEFLLREKNEFGPSNEVMIKERIPPEYITGVVVRDQEMKNDLIDYLRRCHLIQRDRDGNETIFSKFIDQFIHVGTEIKAEQFV